MYVSGNFDLTNQLYVLGMLTVCFRYGEHIQDISKCYVLGPFVVV